MQLSGKVCFLTLGFLLGFVGLTGCTPKEQPSAPSTIPQAAAKPAAPGAPLPGHTDAELKQLQQDDDAGAKRGPK